MRISEGFREGENGERFSETFFFFLITSGVNFFFFYRIVIVAASVLCLTKLDLTGTRYVLINYHPADDSTRGGGKKANVFTRTVTQTLRVYTVHIKPNKFPPWHYSHYCDVTHA